MEHLGSAKYWKYAAGLFMSVTTAWGLFVAVGFAQVNHVRGDEFLSFLHSGHADAGTVFSRIRHGADNSYAHAGMLWAAFKVFGHSMLVQRMLSMCFWLAGGIVLLRCLIFVFSDRLAAFIATSLILFSNLGIFLATDGRCYSMLFMLSTCELLAIILWLGGKSNNALSWVPVIQLIGLLTAPLFAMFQLLVVCACLLAYATKRERIFVRTAGQVLFFALVTGILYYLFFRVTFFLGYFSEKYLNPSSYTIDPAFAEIPFRWIMLPHVPGLSDIGDGIVMITLMVVVLCVNVPKIKAGLKRSGAVYRWLVAGAVLLPAAMLFQLVLAAALNVPLWSSRYYAPLFVFVPIAFVMLVHASDPWRWPLLALISAGCILRVASEHGKIADRREALTRMDIYASRMSNACASAVIELDSGDYREFAAFGELYVRNPGLREKLHYLYNPAGTDPARAKYFNILSKEQYPVHIARTDTLAALNPCVVLKREEDPRDIEAREVMTLGSTF